MELAMGFAELFAWVTLWFGGVLVLKVVKPPVYLYRWGREVAMIVGVVVLVTGTLLDNAILKLIALGPFWAATLPEVE